MTTLTIASTTHRRMSYVADLIFVLVQKEMKVRYKNSALGYAWSVANPLLFAAVYYVALGVFLRFNIPGYPYPLFLIAGLFPWQWLATSVGGAPMGFIANASLIKKVRFPRYVLIAGSVLSDAMHFLLTIPVIVLFLLWYGFVPSWSWVPGIPLWPSPSSSPCTAPLSRWPRSMSSSATWRGSWVSSCRRSSS